MALQPLFISGWKQLSAYYEYEYGCKQENTFKRQPIV